MKRLPGRAVRQKNGGIQIALVGTRGRHASFGVRSQQFFDLGAHREVRAAGPIEIGCTIRGGRFLAGRAEDVLNTLVHSDLRFMPADRLEARSTTPM